MYGKGELVTAPLYTMPPQLHKRFTTSQVKAVLEKYLSKEMSARDALTYLELGRTHFYNLVRDYQKDRINFSIAYARSLPTRSLNSAIEKSILQELQIEKEKIIDNPRVPTKHYNYSYIRSILKEKYHSSPSLSTIIDRAKKHGYWKKKPPKKVHDREVITNFAGELIQHDTSYHLFAPDGACKWYLITSLDDYSRVLLYAKLLLKESSWSHIMALQKVFLAHGLPLQYYVDQHSIFRYVKDRDKNSPWYSYTKFTDEVDPQWKQVLKDCEVKPIYALSPQAKGKVERSYQWLQDHLIRTCVREGITTIDGAEAVLQNEVHEYNTRRVHATIGEIPMIRFQRALQEKKSLFREFKVKPPFQSVRDIFCLRFERVVDSYRRISLKGITLQVPRVMPRQKVEIRLYPDVMTGVAEARFWHKGQFVGSQKIKNDQLPIVHF